MAIGDVEDRVLGAIQTQLLAPNSFEVILQAALAELADRQRGLTDAERIRMSEIDRAIPRLVDAIEAEGDVPELAERLKALQHERTVLRTRAAAFEASRITEEELRGWCRTALGALAEQLRGIDDVTEVREALQALLGSERLRVERDASAQGGYRVKDALRPLRLLRGGSEGAGVGMVAGGCYVRVCRLPVALELPITGRIAA